jgi:transposase
MRKRAYRDARYLNLPDCDTLDRFLVYAVCYRQLSFADLVDMLNVSPSLVYSALRDLRRRGLIPKSRAPYRPTCDPDGVAIVTLARQGYPRPAIAAMRGVTLPRVQSVLRAAKHRYRSRRPRPYPYSVAHLSGIFGVSRRTIHRWVSFGWLPDNRPVVGGGIDLFWSLDDLLAFVRDRRTWSSWSVSSIADQWLAQVAAEVRLEAGGNWYSYKQLAARLNVPVSTLHTWCDRWGLFGTLPRAGKLFWLTHAQLADLDALVLTIGSRPHRRTALRDALLKAFGEG